MNIPSLAKRRWLVPLALLLCVAAIEGWRWLERPAPGGADDAGHVRLAEASSLFLQEQRELMQRSQELAGSLQGRLGTGGRTEGGVEALLARYDDLWGLSLVAGDSSLIWHGYPPSPDGLPNPSQQEPSIRIEQRNNVLYWKCRIPITVRDSSGVTALDLYTSRRIMQSTALPIGSGSEYRFTRPLEEAGAPQIGIRLFNPMPDSVLAHRRLDLMEGDSAGAVFLPVQDDAPARIRAWMMGTVFWRSLYLLAAFLAAGVMLIRTFPLSDPWGRLGTQAGVIALGWGGVRVFDLPGRALTYLAGSDAGPFLRELCTFSADALAVLLLGLSVYLTLKVRSLRFRSNSFLSNLSLAGLTGAASCGLFLSVVDRTYTMLTTAGATLDDLQIIPPVPTLLLYVSVGVMMAGLFLLLLTLIRLMLLSAHDQRNLPAVMLVIGFTLGMGGFYLLAPGAVRMPGTGLYGCLFFVLLTAGLRYGMRGGHLFPLSSVRGLVFGSIAITLAAAPVFQSALRHNTEVRLQEAAAEFADLDDSRGARTTMDLLNTLGSAFSGVDADSLVNQQIFVGLLFNDTIEDFIAERPGYYSYDVHFVTAGRTSLASYSTDLNSPSWLEIYPVDRLQAVTEMQQIGPANPRPVVQRPQLITSAQYQSFHRGWLPLYGPGGDPVAWILASVYRERPNFDKPMRAVLASLYQSDWKESYLLQEFQGDTLLRSSRRGLTGYYPSRNRLPAEVRRALEDDSLFTHTEERDRQTYRNLYRTADSGRVIRATTLLPDFRNRLYHYFQFNFVLLLMGLGAIALREATRSGNTRLLEKSRRFRHRLLDRFLVAVLLFLGILVLATHYALQEQNKESVRQSLYDKMDEMGSQVERTLHSRPQQSAAGRPLLDSLALPFDVDASLYRGQELAESTTPQIYRQHLLPSTMPYGIYRQLYVEGQADAFQNVSLASQDLLVGYRAVRVAGQPPSAALAIPTFLASPKFEQQLLETTSYLIFIYLVVFGAFIGGSLLITRELTAPLREIQDGLNEISRGNFDTTIPVTGDDEIGKLAAAYNEMIRRLRQVRQELVEAEREAAWKEMAQQVAHEIKNPLTPMKLSVQHLERQLSGEDINEEELRASVRRTTENLIEQIETLNTIASDFSKFSQPLDGEFREVDLNAVVRSVAELYDSDRRVQIRSEVTGLPLIILGVEDELRRVVVNLVKNAYEAMPEGGAIVLRTYQKKESAFLEVEDNGSGIPESHKNRIFVPNFSTKSSGTGLGLAIAKKVVEAHEGSISFASIEGQGTTFVIKIPLK
ncbi:MAG: HAMP domain-containing sensor histidine kinase [Balneolaceae bacterium]|nr:HAMP domain-containing sensor histidine kinase [Balneolaceae bacterium]